MNDIDRFMEGGGYTLSGQLSEQIAPGNGQLLLVPAERPNAILRIESDAPVPAGQVGAFLSTLDECYRHLWAVEMILHSQLIPERGGPPLAAPAFHEYLVQLLDELEAAQRQPDALVLLRVSLNSPGFWDFLGKLNPLEVIRLAMKDWWEHKKDQEYRSQAEAKRLQLENVRLEQKIDAEAETSRLNAALLQTKLLSDLSAVIEKLPPEARAAVQDQVLRPLTRISAAGAALATRADLLPVAESFADGRSRRDAFVRGVLPEIDAIEFGKASEIVDFIQSELYDVPQREKVIGLIRRGLRAYINAQAEDFIAVLFTFLIALERYLRANVGEFVCQFAGMSIRDAANASGVVNEDRKHFSFGDLIAIYRQAIQNTCASPAGDGWQELVELRNRISRGEMGLEEWRKSLTILLRCWPSICALTDEIAAATNHSFVFRA